MKNKKSKILTILSATAAALQIPLLMLWKIILDSLKGGSTLIQLKVDPSGNRVFESVFKWELFRASLMIHLPILLALTACFVLSVLGLISSQSQRLALGNLLRIRVVTVIIEI